MNTLFISLLIIFCYVSAHSKGPPVYETATLRPVRHKNPELEAESNLFRCMSDASLIKRRRDRGKSVAQREKERQHRFSINGHFYNYKVAQFGSYMHLCVPLMSSELQALISYCSSTDLHLHPMFWYSN